MYWLHVDWAEALKASTSVRASSPQESQTLAENVQFSHYYAGDQPGKSYRKRHMEGGYRGLLGLKEVVQRH